MRYKIITAEEAASYINHNDNVGFSGFTASGSPKVVPMSSQVQGQSARIKAGLGTASLAPRPSPLAPRPSPLAPRPSPLAPRPSPLAPCRQLATRPRLPAQRPSAGCWWQSHMSREWSWSGR